MRGEDQLGVPAEPGGVAVAVDHRGHRPPLDVGVHELEGCGRDLGGDQRIEHDPAGLAPHEADVGQVQAADLVDPIDDLEQTADAADLRLPPEAWVRHRGSVPIDEVEPVAVPHRPAISRGHHVRERGQPAPACMLEVRPVPEREVIEHGSVRCTGRVGRWCHGDLLLRRARRSEPASVSYRSRERQGRWLPTMPPGHATSIHRLRPPRARRHHPSRVTAPARERGDTVRRAETVVAAGDRAAGRGQRHESGKLNPARFPAAGPRQALGRSRRSPGSTRGVSADGSWEWSWAGKQQVGRGVGRRGTGHCCKNSSPRTRSICPTTTRCTSKPLWTAALQGRRRPPRCNRAPRASRKRSWSPPGSSWSNGANTRPSGSTGPSRTASDDVYETRGASTVRRASGSSGGMRTSVTAWSRLNIFVRLNATTSTAASASVRLAHG